MYSKLTRYSIKKRSLRKIILYSVIVVLYGLASTLLLAAIGTSLIIKYDVEPRYLTIEGDLNLTDSQKRMEYIELEQRENKLNKEYYLLLSGGFILFVTATGLIVKRKTIISGQKATNKTHFADKAG